MTPHREITDPQTLKALSNPLRLQILRYLEDHAASPSMLADVFLTNAATARSHVRILYRLDLVKVVKRVPKRGTMEYHYRAPERVWCSDDSWARMPPIVRTAAAGASLQVLGEEIRAAADAGGFGVEDVYVERQRLTLSAAGWAKLSRELLALRKRILELKAEEEEQIERDGHTDARLASVVLMLFERPPDRAATPAGAAGGSLTRAPRARRASPSA